MNGNGDLFQFPPLCEGRHAIGEVVIAESLFQFPPLCEGRQAWKHFFDDQYDFNSRPCVRGDGFPNSLFGYVEIFQFPPLCEGRHQLQFSIGIPGQFQFPPLCEGRPSSGFRMGPGNTISIPAPV